MWQRLPRRLVGRVFHVTSHAAAEMILGGEGIRNNRDGQFVTGFGTAELSFFRLRGCVSVFDFRNMTKEAWEFVSFVGGLNPAGAARNNPAFLFLADSCFDSLETYATWQAEGPHNRMIVPLIEAGYPDHIPVAMITSALFVTVTPDRRWSWDHP